MHKILMLGPQGSGKGTQAARLSAKLGVPELSMGQLLRDAAAEGGEIGEQIAEIQRSGKLVSDQIALDVLKQRLGRPDVANGFVLDGYPRNEEQFRAFDEFDTPTTVIVIRVPREVSLARLQGRAASEGRADDTPEGITQRLAIYERDTEPMIEHYRARGFVHDVDGVGAVDEVTQRITKIFEENTEKR